jgi:PAS domain S-box-containing protein
MGESTLPKISAIEIESANFVNQVQRIVDAVGGSIYWKNKEGVYLGANVHAIKMVGLTSVAEIIGKTDYDLFSKEEADAFRKNDIYVMDNEKELSKEESVISPDGKKRTQLSIKKPFYGKNNEVIGVIGNTIDITDRKKVEALQLENETQKIKLTEQEKFAKTAAQVAHDIRSPLASLLMIVKSCGDDLPEPLRIVLRDVSINIEDIANNLLSQYGKSGIDFAQTKEPLLVSFAILQILTDKKYQYKDLPIKFNYDFSSSSYFAFIRAEADAFRRMVSNLINNAVDAFEGKNGEVILKLAIEGSKVKFIVRDNGKGISKEVLEKIRNNIAVGSDKKDGHGIGLAQVRETLERNNGEFTITSKIGKGTEITLTFSMITPPNWIAGEILLSQGDTVVILDDDTSIHSAWEMRFKNYANAVNLKHFTAGKEAIDFINKSDKHKILLLTDFELLKQELNGLHVIEQTGITRSILVTSHFNNQVVRDLAKKSKTKILPKQLASVIPIKLSEAQASKLESSNNKVDAVIVEDNEVLANSLAMLFQQQEKAADVYYSGKEFLNHFSKYDLDTKIFLDYNLDGITGLEIAKTLHSAGFTNLYLLSGWDFAKDEIPNYLTVLSKGSPDFIQRMLL